MINYLIISITAANKFLVKELHFIKYAFKRCTFTIIVTVTMDKNYKLNQFNQFHCYLTTKTVTLTQLIFVIFGM